jgi:hypothetical protein
VRAAENQQPEPSGGQRRPQSGQGPGAIAGKRVDVNGENSTSGADIAIISKKRKSNFRISGTHRAKIEADVPSKKHIETNNKMMKRRDCYV